VEASLISIEYLARLSFLFPFMSRGIGNEWNWVFFYRMVGIAVVEVKVTLFPDRLRYGPKPD
jgi:hypothetical protein